LVRAALNLLAAAQVPDQAQQGVQVHLIKVVLIKMPTVMEVVEVVASLAEVQVLTVLVTLWAVAVAEVVLFIHH
jgi:hypothetical protein